jgi:ADP-ribosyl-[dinitrogen reductase] hydrolase
MAPCPIEKNFPALLLIAYKYADSVEKAILANANAGGENVSRGHLLGPLLGAALGFEAFPAWTKDLVNAKDIENEIDLLI